MEKEEKFIDIAQNVEDMNLRTRLIAKYLKDEDFLCNECGRLSKKYYFNGCADMLNLVIECGGAVDGN